MWMMIDFFDLQTDAREGYKSSKALWKYNCKDETQAIVSILHTSGSMGNGDIVWSDSYKESELIWRPIVPESLGENLWKIACGKK